MRTTKLLLTALAATAMAAVPMASGKQQTVTVKIWRVAQVDNLDKGDFLGADRADFYSLVTIGDNPRERSLNHSDDDGHPGWEFKMPANTRYVPIRIRVMDDDGGLEEKDDHVDVSPVGDKKDLDLTFDTATGRITGDVSGSRGEIIYVIGGGDNDKGKLWFSIS